MKRLLFFLSALLCLPFLHAQSSSPLCADENIILDFDESGKLTSPPAGFALVEGRHYQLAVTVRKPQQQRNAFWKAMADNCRATLDRLEDPDDSLAMRLAGLHMPLNLDSLKYQLGGLDSILRLDSAQAAAFKAYPSSFSYFLGKKFIGEQLFGPVFAVRLHYNQSDTTIALTADKDCVFAPVPFSCPADSFVVTVRVADLQKQFLKNYYTEARKQVTGLFDPIRPTKFYNKDIRAFLQLQQRFDDFFRVLGKMNKDSLIICDQKTIDEYEKLKDSYAGFIGANNLSKIIRSQWIGVWLWYTHGVPKVNPLPFTDGDRLVLEEGYDKEKAAIYDAYIESAVQQMEHSLTLNATKADYACMDSLLRQMGTGAERFSLAPENKALAQTNAAQAKKFQAVRYTLHQAVFKVVKCKDQEAFRLRTYSADRGPAKDNFPMTVSTGTKVEAVVYNLKAGQTVALLETPKDMNDQSDIIRQLNQAGDVYTTALGQVGAALGPFSNLTGAFKPYVPAFNPKTIPFENVQDSSSSFNENKQKTSKRVKVYSLEVKELDVFRLRLYRDGVIIKESPDLLTFADRYLAEKNLLECALFADKVHSHVRNYLQKTYPDAIYTGRKYPGELIGYSLESINAGILEIIDSLYGLEVSKLKTIYDSVLLKRRYLALVADFFGASANYTLPPKEFKNNIDSVPRYANQYRAFAKEESAKKKDFELTLTDAKSKPVIKWKDSYKTAPTHRFTASLGVAYVFRSFRRSEATLANGVITNTPDEDQFRLITALHYHPFAPVILADNRSVFKLKTSREFFSRMSLFAGCSYPKPLYNPHIGIALDLWPGVKLATGIHFYRYTSYQILNNQIADQHSAYRYNGGFCSFSLEPLTFAKLIGLVK